MVRQNNVMTTRRNPLYAHDIQVGASTFSVQGGGDACCAWAHACPCGEELTRLFRALTYQTYCGYMDDTGR
eukprot:1189953-Prorocentrum_minimum.AAC.5